MDRRGRPRRRAGGGRALRQRRPRGNRRRDGRRRRRAAVARARLRRRPRPRLGRVRRDGLDRGPRRDGAGPAPPGRHVVPAVGLDDPDAGPPGVRRARPRVDAERAGRWRRAARVQPRGPVHLGGAEGRPQPGVPPDAGGRAVVGDRAAPRRPPPDDDRARDPRRARADPAAAQARGPGRDRPFRRGPGAGARGLRRGRHDDDAPVQRDDRDRAPVAGRRGRRL